MTQRPIDLSRITNKFYRTEEERINLLEKYRPYTDQLYTILEQDIKKLYKQGFNFIIFFMDFSVNKPTLHLGIMHCCGGGDPVPRETKEYFEDKINTSSPFEIVKWEM